MPINGKRPQFSTLAEATDTSHKTPGGHLIIAIRKHGGGATLDELKSAVALLTDLLLQREGA